MNPTQIKVVVLDNSPVVIRGVEAILKPIADMQFSGGYTTSKDLLRELNENCVDVLLTEVSVEDANFEQIIAAVRKKSSLARTVVLTNLDNMYHTRVVMRQGASGYLLKTSQEEKIVYAIRSVHAGEQYIEPSIKESIFQKALLNKNQSRVNLS